MGRRLIRTGEALRRLMGKPGRRKGERRRGKETGLPQPYSPGAQQSRSKYFDYVGPIEGGGTGRLIMPNRRSGKDRRKSK